MLDHVFHSKRSHSGGFSLIELLITIVLAGIVFAAMVPLFVNASQKSAGDNLRDICVQVAQDKIEKLRTIDYDSINSANFGATAHQTYAGGQFADFNYSQGGVVKVIHVSYTITLFPATATPGTEQYKIISISAWWDGNPYPHKTTILQTNIYKQYAGPQLTDFVLVNSDGSDIGTITVNNPDGTQSAIYAITSFPVYMTVQIPSADLVSMNPGNGSYGLVQFSITNSQGTVMDTQAVYPTQAAQTAKLGSASGALWGVDYGVDSNGWYFWNWDGVVSSGAVMGGGRLDGLYSFQAVAQDSGKFFGNTWGKTYRVETGPPPAPSGASASGNNNAVGLTWAASSATDIAYYKIYRSLSLATPVAQWSALPDPANPSNDLTVTVPNYNDATVTNGTTYYYVVRSFDDLGHASDPSSPVSATPQVQAADSTPPTAPSGVTAVKSGANIPSILLAWTASTDPTPPPTPSGVKLYIIERSAASAGPWSQIQTNLLQPSPLPTPPTITYTDASAGYSTTWYYRITAVDNMGNYSLPSSVVSATTDGPKIYQLTVTNNNQSSTAYCYVQSQASPNLYYTQGSSVSSPGTSSSTRPGDTSINKKGKTANWYLPAGLYWVFYKYGGSTYSTQTGDISVGSNGVTIQ